MEWRRAFTDLTKKQATDHVTRWKEQWRAKGKPIPKLTIRKDPNGRHEVWVWAS